VNLKARISRLEQATKPNGGIQCRQFQDECICYPDLPCGLDLKAAEIRAAEELPCPLHGKTEYPTLLRSFTRLPGRWTKKHDGRQSKRPVDDSQNSPIALTHQICY
jgi:hypothetical protein